MDIKKDQLSGKNNKRLKETTPMKSEYTAAWANIEGMLPESNVPQPALEDVINAKEWVDNGSKL